MGLFDFFLGKRPASAGIAKERLQIVLSHERAARDAPDFMPALQRDLLTVVGRYVAIKEDLIRVKVAKHTQSSVLEINIEFDPEAPAMIRPPPNGPATPPP